MCVCVRVSLSIWGMSECVQSFCCDACLWIPPADERERVCVFVFVSVCLCVFVYLWF